MTPYYAQRRALMLRSQAEQDPALVEAALQALAGERVGALVVAGPLEDRAGLIRRMTALGLEPVPFISGATPRYFCRRRVAGRTRRNWKACPSRGSARRRAWAGPTRT